MFICKRHSENDFFIENNLSKFNSFDIPKQCLLTASIKLLSHNLYKTSTAFSLCKSLNVAVKHIASPAIYNLLLSSSDKLSVNDVVAGYKELEHYIQIDMKSRYSSFSSAFRNLMSNTKFRMSDGICIEHCHFTTRFKLNNVSLMPTKLCETSNIHILRTHSSKTSAIYWTIDPDTLMGLIHPNGLLDISLRYAATKSINSPIHMDLPKNWLRTMQIIAFADNNEKIKYLFNSKPDSITAKDIFDSFFQLEEILFKYNSSAAYKKSSELRYLLNLGGKTSSGIRIKDCHFISRFSDKRKKEKVDIKNQLVPEQTFTLKVLSDNTCSYYYLKYPTSNKKALIRTSLLHLSVHSENEPIKYLKFYKLRSLLNILSNEINVGKEFRFLHESSKKLSYEEVMDGIASVNEMKVSKLNLNLLKELLFKFGDFNKNVEDTLKQKRQINLGSNLQNYSDTFLELLAPNGLLQTCFLASKWDYLPQKYSQSLVSYDLRLVLSKLFIYLINYKEIPYTRLLLNSEPALITPLDIYCCYTEVESILYKNNFTISVKTFINFLEKYAVKISHNLPFKCIFTSQLSVKDNKILYTEERNFTLQKVYGPNIKKNYLPFSQDRLSGIMKPKSLILECLLASENYPMPFHEARLIRIQLHNISKNNRSTIKTLLSTSKKDITYSLLLEGLTGFESILEHDKKLHNRSKRATSIVFTNFLTTWSKEIIDPTVFKTLSFSSRFERNGQVKCIKPFSIQGTAYDGKYISIHFNTYLLPDLYKPTGLLTTSLLTVKQNIEKYTSSKLYQWSVLIEHIINSHTQLPSRLKIIFFLSTPLEQSTRITVTNAINALEYLIRIMDTKDKKSYFNGLLELLSLSNRKIADGRSIAELNYKCPFSIINEEHIIRFRVKYTSNSKEKISQCEFDISEINILHGNDGVLITSLQRASRHSQLSPISRTNIYSVITTIKNINHYLNRTIVPIDEHNADQHLRHFLTSPVKKLNPKDIKVGLKKIESIIDKNNTNSKFGISGKFRNFLSLNNDTLLNNLKISECGFKSRFYSKNTMLSNKLIIPINEITLTPLPEPNITKFNSIRELKENINTYYQKPVNSIISKVQNEIKLYKKFIEEFSPMVERNENKEFTFIIPEQLHKQILHLANNRKDNNKELNELINEFGKTNVRAAFFQLRMNTPINQKINYSGCYILIPDDYQPWFSVAPINFFFSSTFLLPKEILLACFIRLIIHTTWNKSAVASLKGENLPHPLPAGTFFIQGYKSKVKKPTTQVEITPSDHEVRDAIELITTHYNNMVELGFTPESIWETPTSKNLTFLDTRFLSVFIMRHHLPQFTIEQLAKHQINVRKGIDSNIRQSQIERNHSQLKTTSTYVDNPLARIYYDANNAEFQKRLEATVIFRHSGPESLKEYSLSKGDIDLKLFAAPSDETGVPYWFQLPDGSTCTDIWAPIDKTSKNQQFCGGRKCHSGDGCPHNRILISTEDFVYTLRHQRWFIARCEALLLKHTHEYFNEYIAPSMRFTFGLARYVQTSNPEMYQHAERILTSIQEGKR